MSGTWGCPHEFDGLCKRLNGAYCDPGMRGCVLDGKVEFRDGKPHVPRWPEKEDDSRSAPDGGRDSRVGHGSTRSPGEVS